VSLCHLRLYFQRSQNLKLKMHELVDVIFIGAPGHPSYQPLLVAHMIVLDLCLRCERISVARVSESSHRLSLSRKVSVACDKKATFVTLIKARQSKTLSLRCMHRANACVEKTGFADHNHRPPGEETSERLILHALLSHTHF
jgi:hypothetical protein